MSERPKLAKGLVWRQKENGGYHPFIYFKKMYRGHYLRESSKTSDPEEAERRLRKKLTEIDAIEVDGIRPKKTFSEGAKKAIEEFQGSAKTLLIYAAQADILRPWIADNNLPVWKDDLKGFIDKRWSEKVKARTINLSLEFVRMVNRKACYYWKDEQTSLSWTDHCPIISFEKGPKGKPYPLSWNEQERFFDLLPGHERRAAVFAVNTGLRESPILSLEWSWERYVPSLNDTVFDIPGEILGIKNRKNMVLVLNRSARRIVDLQRGQYPIKVFGDMKQITTGAWYKAWRLANLPAGKEWKRGVHNLRHTFGKRLRDAGVDERDVQDLLHHVPKNITRHYSEPELKKLKECLERLVPGPSLALVAQN